MGVNILITKKYNITRINIQVINLDELLSFITTIVFPIVFPIIKSSITEIHAEVIRMQG